MHARDGNWDAVLTRMREVIGEDDEIPDEYELRAVFVTGSLAYGGGTPHESDVDLVIGDNREEEYYPLEEVGVVTQVLQEFEDEFARLLDLPVTDVHIVEVRSARQAPNRAMELQHQGQQLARQHNVDKSIEMKIYDAVRGEVYSDARDVPY